MTEKLYGDPEQMSVFDSMMQGLLEAIEMEYGKGRREEVEKKLLLQQAWNGFTYINDKYEPTFNEIDTYISEVNSPDHFIEKVNSLPMPETYPHEDDSFYIPEKYRNITRGELKTEKEKLLKELLKRRKQMKEIKIKYFTDKIEKLTYIGGSKRSNWIDLRAAETIELKAGDFKLIPLGVAMKLPEGFEAHIAPRSSTFKTWGLIQVNSVGVVDQGYCGNDDQWMMPVYATRDTVINVNDRVCQFRIIENQPEIEFIEVEHMEDESRGGFGSTGKQ